MPYQISEAPDSSEELSQTIGGIAGLAAMSPIGGRLLFGGLKMGLKVGWGATKLAAKTGVAAAKIGWAGRGLAANGAASYGGAALRAGLQAARTVAGGAAYGAIKAGGWIYRNPGMALIAAAPLGLGMAAYDNEHAAGQGQVGSPNITEMMGGTAGGAGINALMDSMNATGDVVLGMHKKR